MIVWMLKARNDGSNRRTTTLYYVVFGLVGLIVGLVLLAWSGEWSMHRLSAELGGLFLVTALVTLLWELQGRRVFLAEILESVQVSADIRAAGVGQIGMRYLEDIDWSDTLAGAKEVDLVISWGNTWRNQNHERLREIVRRGGRLRVFLPDTEDTDGMAVLSSRFEMPLDEVRTLIASAVKDFAALKGGTGSVEVWLRPAAMPWALYRVDSRAVFTLYKIAQERGNVPVILAAEPGSLYSFACDEVNALCKISRPATDCP